MKNLTQQAYHQRKETIIKSWNVIDMPGCFYKCFFITHIHTLSSHIYETESYYVPFFLFFFIHLQLCV